MHRTLKAETTRPAPDKLAPTARALRRLRRGVRHPTSTRSPRYETPRRRPRAANQEAPAFLPDPDYSTTMTCRGLAPRGSSPVCTPTLRCATGRKRCVLGVSWRSLRSLRLGGFDAPRLGKAVQAWGKRSVCACLRGTRDGLTRGDGVRDIRRLLAPK